MKDEKMFANFTDESPGSILVELAMEDTTDVQDSLAMGAKTSHHSGNKMSTGKAFHSGYEDSDAVTDYD